MRYINIYINLVYLTYFLLLIGFSDPINVKLLFILAVLGLVLKVVFLKLYYNSKKYILYHLFKPLEILISLISLLLLLKNFKFLIYSFGILTISIYCLIFLVGYFIGISKKENKKIDSW